VLFDRAAMLIRAFCEGYDPLTPEDPRINLLSGDCEGDNFFSLIEAAEGILIPIREEMIPEDVYGSTAYLTEPEDVYLIRSFMIGLNMTGSLKGDHPGLGTTAIRAGTSLLIMNEIGMTDYNFLVLKITGAAISLTYIDPHLARTSFFQSMMQPYPVFWKEIISRNKTEKDQFKHVHIATGSFTVRSPDEMLMFLSHISSHIVFLIEWNRARKALKPFLSGNETLIVLQKAVKRRVGHQAFIVAGGERLISEVLESVPEISLKNGGTLTDILGSEDAIEFCVSVLEIANRYVCQNLPKMQLREDIRSELVRQYSHLNEDICRVFNQYARAVREIVILFNQLIAVLPDHDMNRRNAVEVRIQNCSGEIDACVTMLWGKSRRRYPDGAIADCFFQMHKAVELLGEAGYLSTLIPQTGLCPDIVAEMTHLSDYIEYVASFLYYSVESSEITEPWENAGMKDLKRYSTNVSQFLASSDQILRSAKRRKYAGTESDNTQAISYEILLLLRDVLDLMISGVTSLTGGDQNQRRFPELMSLFSDIFSKREGEP
jgi:hypothetical protein